MGRIELKNRPPLLRYPNTVYPVGKLSDFPHRREVGRKATSDRPGAGEEHDPVVYIQIAERGRKPLADLFYILHDQRRHNGVRVYFQEVVDDA